MSKMAPMPRPPEGDVDVSYKLEVGTTVTFIAAALVVGLRFMARIRYARLGWDDYVMMFATVYSSLGYAAKKLPPQVGSSGEPDSIFALGPSSRRNCIGLCCHPLGPGSAHFFPKTAAASPAAVLFAAGPSLLHPRPDLCENQHLPAIHTCDPGLAEKLAALDLQHARHPRLLRQWHSNHCLLRPLHSS